MFHLVIKNSNVLFGIPKCMSSLQVLKPRLDLLGVKTVRVNHSTRIGRQKLLLHHSGVYVMLLNFILIIKTLIINVYNESILKLLNSLQFRSLSPGE